jgi:glucosamine-6-phosphate deaminase
MKSVSDSHVSIGIYESRNAMGAAAAHRFQTWVEEALRAKPRCRVVFGCAPSQDEFFSSLVSEARARLDLWKRVEVFHMDDYVGLPDAHPQSFRTYLRRHFLDHIEPAYFHPIRGAATSATVEAERYAALLAEAPIDVIGMGIGENGHVAFNDPPVANFSDPVLAKVVELDGVCRQQQVNDGCFPRLSLVPRLAITITLPVFAQAGSLCCIAPGIRKARAVRSANLDSIGPACPATVLRTHPRAELFLDREAASLLPPDFIG